MPYLIMILMLNCQESFIEEFNPHVFPGKSKNPHDLTRSPGGSSGGEGALIASGGSLLGTFSLLVHYYTGS